MGSSGVAVPIFLSRGASFDNSSGAAVMRLVFRNLFSDVSRRKSHRRLARNSYSRAPRRACLPRRDGEKSAMFTLTAPDGSKVKIDGKLVIRARRTVYGEATGEKAQTRIDWVDMQLVQEPLSEVAPQIKAELPTFVMLTSRDGSNIWFNGKEATGPMPLTPSQQKDGLGSAIKLMSYRQFVRETPDEVRTLLAANGGTVVP
jgi:hypothetical protein